jgi:hypothetical protein
VFSGDAIPISRSAYLHIVADDGAVGELFRSWRAASVCGIEFARLPGHANISTTQRYMHLDDR